MIKVTIESTVSTNYHLFRLRWLIIVIQTACMALDITLAILSSAPLAKPVYITLIFISLLSIVVCVADISLHKKGTTPPSSPKPSYHDTANPLDRRSLDTTVQEQMEAGEPSASMNIDVEEQVPFLPPPITPTGDEVDLAPSEKSDSEELISADRAATNFKPNLFVTFADGILILDIVTFYIFHVVIESCSRYYWYDNDRVYAVKIHMAIGMIAAALLHLHCFFAEMKAFRELRWKKKNPVEIVGVIRI